MPMSTTPATFEISVLSLKLERIKLAATKKVKEYLNHLKLVCEFFQFKD